MFFNTYIIQRFKKIMSPLSIDFIQKCKIYRKFNYNLNKKNMKKFYPYSKWQSKSVSLYVCKSYYWIHKLIKKFTENKALDVIELGINNEGGTLF